MTSHDFRADPPAVFYKYYPLKAWLPELLSGQKLRFSSRAFFNDPFDSRPAWRYDISDKGYAKQLNLVMIQQGLPARVRRERIDWLRRNAEWSPNFDGTNEALDAMGIFSLGTSWSNMLLWSHYADQHAGICIGFHSNLDVFRVALKVKYSNEYPIVRRPSDDSDAITTKTFLIKQQCWEYEEEWRVVKRALSTIEEAAERLRFRHLSAADADLLCLQRGFGDYAFDKSAIAEITVGLKVDASQVDALHNWIDTAGIQIPVYQIIRDVKSYELTRKLIRK